MPAPNSHSSVAIAFLQRFVQDREAGESRTLAEYQAMFPGAEEIVAQEYAAVMAAKAGPADGDPVLDLASARDRYQHVEVVGKGGMGTVRKVFDRALGRHVAMKYLGDDAAAGSRPALLARFLREAKITSRLQHPGIVPVLDVGLDDRQRPYYTMPLIEGRNLSEVVRQFDEDPQSNLLRIVDVAARVCEALGYAHERGVVHRDLKPANVMVGPFGGVFVVDWGLARRRDDDDLGDDSPDGDVVSEADLPPTWTVAGDVVGTPAYMAPEQARGETVGPRSDVYSLGALLYFVIARQAPYVDGPSNDSKVILSRVRSGPPAGLRALAPSAPPALVSICERAMARDPDDRYASAGALAGELRAFLDNRVVAAHRTGPVAEIVTWTRRNRGTALAGALAVILLVVGLAVSVALKLRSDDNAGWARENFELAFAAAEGLLVEFGVHASTDDPAVDRLRSAMADRALGFYRRFAELRQDDVRVADKVALSHFRVASFESQLGNVDVAVAALGRARQHYAELAAAQPGNLDYRVELARIDIERSLIRIERGEAGAAIVDLEAAVEITAGLLAERHDDTGLRHTHGSALHNLAMAVLAAGDAERGIELIEQKIASARLYVAAAPDRPRSHEQLASGLQLRGTALADRADLEGAERCFVDAVAVLDGALAQFPRDRGLRWRRSETLNLLGVVASQQRKGAAAIAAFERVVDDLRPLVAANPDVRDFVGTMAGALCNLGMMTRGRGQPESALGLLEQARHHIANALKVDPDHAEYRNYRRIIGRELAVVALMLEDHEAAARHTRELVAEQPGEHDWIAAVMIASCATLASREQAMPAAERGRLVGAYGDEAMAFLRASVERGTARLDLLHDTSFDGIRDREDFRAVQSDRER